MQMRYVSPRKQVLRSISEAGNGSYLGNEDFWTDTNVEDIPYPDLSPTMEPCPDGIKLARYALFSLCLRHQALLHLCPRTTFSGTCQVACTASPWLLGKQADIM